MTIPENSIDMGKEIINKSIFHTQVMSMNGCLKKEETIESIEKGIFFMIERYKELSKRCIDCKRKECDISSSF